MAGEGAEAPEVVKGHVSYKILVAQARKKPMTLLDEGLSVLEKKGSLTVLKREQQSRAKLLRQYEFLQVILASAEEQIHLDEELVRDLDQWSITTKGLIWVGMTTFKETDIWLKWNIKEQTGQFQIRGGTVDIQEEKYTQPNGAVVRTCSYQLRGDLRLAIQYRDRLIEHKLGDPKTLQYGFWVPPTK